MKRKKFKENNEGFSLVELIIVIAIMAILVGIVGTQVLPYIDKAKEAKDIQIVSGYCTDATTAFVSCADQVDTNKTYTITATKGVSGWSVNAKDDTDADCEILKKAFTDMNELDTKAPNLQSKEGKKITEISIVCKHGNLTAKLTVKGPKNPEAFEAETK